MKKIRTLLLFLALIGFLFPSCSRGTGCPAESAQVKTDKGGNPKKGTSQHLFPKKMRKN